MTASAWSPTTDTLDVLAGIMASLVEETIIPDGVAGTRIVSAWGPTITSPVGSPSNAANVRAVPWLTKALRTLAPPPVTRMAPVDA